MPSRNKASAILLFSATMLVAAQCGEKPEDTAVAPDCQSVTANAGPDQSVALGANIALSGAGSTLCAGATSLFNWSFVSIPVESEITEADFLTNDTEAAVDTEFTPDAVGTYVVGLVVTSGDLASTEDVVVIDITSDNQPPVANCGPDVSTPLGERVMLDGSSSYDPENLPLTYHWALSTTPDGSSLSGTDIYNSGGATPTVIPDVGGTYIVSLAVSDGDLWSEPDYCTVSVSTLNQAPIADAGDGGTLPPCTEDTITLNGYGSYDQEGSTLEYLWSLVSSPSGSSTSDASFDDPSKPAPKFTWDLTGEYTFQLDVFDGAIWSAPDVVTYSITDRADNLSPIANAGDNQTIDESADCSGSGYTEYTCEDCDPETVELDGSGSFDPNGDAVTYFWAETTGELDIGMPYSAFTEVTTPAMTADLSTTNTTVWTLTLEVADCAATSDDTITITYECTGER